MIRLLKIARREYLAYVRTVGFWLSMCLMPLGFAVTFVVPAMMDRTAPVPRLAVIDLTGQDYAADIAAALRPPPWRDRSAPPPRPAARIVPSPIGAPASAEEAGGRLRPYLAGESDVADGRRLDAAAVIHRSGAQVTVDYWSRNVVDRSLEGLLRDAVGDRMRSDRLAAAGVPEAEIAALDALSPKIADYSPKAATGRIEFRDRLPGITGFALGIMLWAMILSGAGILLNSVIEEKSSRILELLLASASAPEIMGGKILGVAGVTVTVLGVWMSVGAAVLYGSSPAIAADVLSVLTRHGLIVYFIIYLLAGYLMYAGLFTAIGAFCETTREAQTLLAPMMMLMTIPVVFMGQAITRPDAPIVAALVWFPLFTPFLAPARAAADPPLWEVLGSTALIVAAAAGSLWLSAKAFRAGALASGKSGPAAMFAALFEGLRRR